MLATQVPVRQWKQLIRSCSKACPPSSKIQWTRTLVKGQQTCRFSSHADPGVIIPRRPLGRLLVPNKGARHVSSTTTTTETSGLPRVLINDLRSQEIVVDFNNGQAFRYPSFWLRDHCRCEECVHPSTNRRRVETFQLNLSTKATSATPSPKGLQVAWSDPDHASTYPWEWLRQHEPFSAKPRTTHPRSGWQEMLPASPTLPLVDYKALMTTDVGLSTLLSQIRTYGLSFVTDSPPTPEATEQLIRHIAFIRATRDGSFYDFTSESDSIDAAYTGLACPARTDTTYFTDPCGLHIFHVLTPASQGGESTFVDGFAAAQHLYKLNPTFYQILSQIPIISHASGGPHAGDVLNTSVSPAGFPVFTHATPHQPALYRPQNLTQIRWNPAERHASTVWPSHQSMQTWYVAAKAWSELLASSEFEINVRLIPGMPVVLDNWRTLHGRKAFAGRRRVCGAYVAMDEFLARARLVDASVAQHLEERIAGDGESKGEETVKVNTGL